MSEVLDKSKIELEKRKLKTTKALVVFLIVFLFIGIGAATYAWFTFNTATNVTPISSTISDGEASLLISNSYNGDYSPSCTLVLSDNVTTLEPMSTADLEHYYKVVLQDSEGISLMYKEEEKPYSELMHGTVYLKCLSADSDVYFYDSGLNFGQDAQTLSAMRLGLKLTGADGVSRTYIFDLSSMAYGTVRGKKTVPGNDLVVKSINENGSANYADDSSVSIGNYMARKAENDSVLRGSEKLMSLRQNEIATVEYWLYLEGCDENCFNSVQSSNVNLQLAFAGVKQDGQ